MSEGICFNPSDFARLRVAIRDEVRTEITKLRERSPADAIYVVALFDFSDSWCPSLSFGCNSERHFSATLEQRLKQPHSNSLCNQAEFIRWHPSEWESHDSLIATQIIYEIIESHGLEVVEDTKQKSQAYEELQVLVQVEMIQALRVLDHEGLFGAGDDRKKVILTISTEDEGDSDPWLHQVSAKLLNSTESFLQYLQEYRVASEQTELSKARLKTFLTKIDASDLVSRFAT